MKNALKPLLLLTFFVATGFFQPTFGQTLNDETLMTIAGKKVTVGEFMSIYQKNNPKNEAIDRNGLREYLDLFVNFKLKVKEAEELGLDTLTSFKTELAGYREQLAKPYFSDEETIERLTKEAYDRSLNDLRASHIFLRVKPDALPADTLAAYEKITRIRERIINGESFEDLAVEFSEDPSARDREATTQHPYMKGNKGDLGFFTVFDMVYPFETRAYNTPVGQISQPVRSEYGYHIIKISQMHPAMRKVIVAHMFLSIPKGANSMDSSRIHRKIDSLYNVLKGGASWEDVVKQNSDDKGTAAKGGALPKFGVNRMVPEFISAIYNLQKVGDFSTPILTTYGWHIIRLVEREEIKSYLEERPDLRQKVTKDSRSHLGRQVILERIKKEYGFTEYPDAVQEVAKVVTDSVFFAKWNPAVTADMNKLIFKVGNMNFRQKDLGAYIGTKQRKKEKEEIRTYVNRMYNEFLEESLIKWENSHLEEKYPEFRALMSEYRDGILLFDLTDQKVWSKAVKDTTGLKAFYEKNKYSYMWGDRLDASVFTVKDQPTADRVLNFVKTGTADDDILKEINKDTVQLVTVESGKFSKNENKFVDKVTWMPGITSLKEGSDIIIVNARKLLKPEPKQLNEARGLITADYQNYLEKEWIKELKQKYPVVVNQEVFAKIK